ncbi:unnamed protein product [Durusdinium trenchii]|uniref:Uncharacterized protein n=1 Tax=Durusdinium trenchii TaxID=1381693 RepID=A0ABP0K6U0_9DINO
MLFIKPSHPCRARWDMFRYMPPSVDKCPHDHFRALLYLELLHLSAVLFICVSLLVFSQIESTLASCPDDNVDPSRTVTWNAPTCELRCPMPNPMPEGFEWDSATSSARCEPGYLGPASTLCTVNNETCQVTTVLSGCRKLMPCQLPVMSPVEQCQINMTTCRGIMPGESCRPKCIPPFELYGAALASCPENNLDADTTLEWQAPNCSVFQCDDPSPVPAGYEYGIDQNSPAAIAEGVPRWYCVSGYVGTAQRLCSSNATCGVVAVLSGCDPIIPCRPPPNLNPCRVDASQCASVRPGNRCIMSCRPPFLGRDSVLSCPVRNTDGRLLGDVPTCQLDPDFDPIPLDIGFASDYEGFHCGAGYTGPVKTVCRMQPGCRTTTYPEGCAPPVPCDVGSFQDEDGRRGIIGGNFTFGRSQLDTVLNVGQAQDLRTPYVPIRFGGQGTMYEDKVEGYDIYFVDVCQRLITDEGALASVDAKSTSDPILCCDAEVYTVQFTDVVLKEAYTGLAVNPETGAGERQKEVVAKIQNRHGLELSVNYWVLQIEDRIDPITGAASIPIASMVFVVIFAQTYLC